MEGLRKSRYKAHLVIVKVSPFILGLLYALNTLLAYFYIEITWAGYIGHLALIPALSLISQSFVLQFCVYHRLPYGITLYNDQLYDSAYVACMCKADFLGSSITDEKHMALYIKDVIDDEDAYDGIVFNRWYADMCYTGVAIDWEDML